MRVIFLDIDGVLNSWPYFATLPADKSRLSRDERDAMMIDPAAVEQLNKLAAAIEAGIVVSSSWRWKNTKNQLEEVLRKKGFEAAFLGVTPILTSVPSESGLVIAAERGDEIQAWLNVHPEVDSFVILDDNSDMGKLKPYLVKTSMSTGLADAHVDAAIRLVLHGCTVPVMDKSAFGPLNEMADHFYGVAKEKGFHDQPVPLSIGCSNLHSEVSELWEAHRNGTLNNPCDKSEKMVAMGLPPLTCMEEELADILIRVLDTAREHGIDIAAAVAAKDKYNQSRPHMNGGKTC